MLFYIFLFIMRIQMSENRLHKIADLTLFFCVFKEKRDFLVLHVDVIKDMLLISLFIF